MTINERPKPKPPVKHHEKKPAAKQEKKPFTRKEHLMDRPLKSNEVLNQLRNGLGKGSK